MESGPLSRTQERAARAFCLQEGKRYRHPKQARVWGCYPGTSENMGVL